MKHTSVYVNTLLGFCCFAVVSIMPNYTYGGLRIPYQVDEHTLHLWHFDDPQMIDGLTNIYCTDAVAVASITLTNSGLPGTNLPPQTNTWLGEPSYTGLGTCRKATTRYAIAYGGQFTDVSQFCNPETGAFTFEALVKFDVNPLAPPNNMQIVCGDQSGAINVRGWQFRVNTAGQLEWNLLAGSGSDNNFKPPLPSSGPNAAIVGQWYHVAVAFTGNNPTNGDTPNELRFYWTLLDPYRTNADLLATYTMTRPLDGSPSGTAQPWLGIGGSARYYPNNIGNGEGIIGCIDEVRISSVCRKANEMAFTIAGEISPPSFQIEPATNILIGYGKTLAIPTIAVGTPPLQYQWQFATSPEGVFTDLPGQTANTLVVSNITFAGTGAYRVVVTNDYGAVTSRVAQVTVGAAFSELFNTGVDEYGVVNTNELPNNPDPHYRLIYSSDLNNPGPNTIVWNMFTYPIALYGGNFANPDGKSQWIGPQANSYSSPTGQYVYRITFLLDSVDLTQPAKLEGIWYVNEIGNDILINGKSTGNSISSVQSSSGKFSYPFTITNGFVPGLNTLDFVTTRSTTANPSYQQSALRVDFSDPTIELNAVGYALPPGPPQIIVQPAHVVVREGGRAEFSVVALGRPPLNYQWYANNGTEKLQDATKRTLRFDAVYTGNQGTNFQVVVSNDSGSVTSQVATLTLTTNRPPIVQNYSFGIYTNQTLDFNLIQALYSATDPDGDQLTIDYFDTFTTNAVELTQNGVILTYTPPEGYVGADQFTYTITDGTDWVPGTVTIWVNPLQMPNVTSPTIVGTNLVFSLTAGAPLCSFSVLSSTNINTPLSEWTIELVGSFNLSGTATVTNAIAPSTLQKFYTVRVP